MLGIRIILKKKWI